jgi:hypothetical protein
VRGTIPRRHDDEVDVDGAAVGEVEADDAVRLRHGARHRHAGADIDLRRERLLGEVGDLGAEGGEHRSFALDDGDARAGADKAVDRCDAVEAGADDGHVPAARRD